MPLYGYIGCSKGFLGFGKKCSFHEANGHTDDESLRELFRRLKKEGVIEKFAAVLVGMADVTLENAFGAEWTNLTDVEQMLIRQDFLEAGSERITVREYLRRIGRGNLNSYAKTMVARLLHGWNRRG